MLSLPVKYNSTAQVKPVQKPLNYHQPFKAFCMKPLPYKGSPARVFLREDLPDILKCLVP